MANGVVVSDAIVTLRQWLTDSDFKPGERIPSERRLIRDLGLTHNAVNRAMSLLISEGLVQREGYKLYYASGNKPAAAVAFGCDLVLARRSIHLRSYRKVAKELGIDLRIHHYESLDEVLAHLHVLDDPKTESVLLDPPHRSSSLQWAAAMARLLAHGIPAVSIRQYADNIPCVMEDQVRALELVFAHLAESGHEEMALLMVAPRAPGPLRIHRAWSALPWSKKERASAKRVAFYDDARDEIELLADKLAGEWRNVTALVVHTVHDPVVPHLIEALARRGRHVPKDLSVIGLGDLPHLSTTNPPVSTAAFDAALIHETGFRLAQRLARKRQGTGLLPPVPCLHIEPYLTLRESTRPTATFVARKKPSTGEGPAFSLPLEQGTDPAGFRQSLRAMLKRPYAVAMTAEPSRFTAIDLAPFVNRPLNYRKGWLGDLPLAHLSAGKHVIHGIPFQLLGGPARSDRGAIVFRSKINETGNSRGLPSRVKIPVGMKATGIYILHGCGYTRFLTPFATYDFYAGTRLLGSVPMVALGQPPYDWNAAQFGRDSQKANIQDWWSDFPHVDFPGARQAPIVPTDDKDATNRYAFLYTLEWNNPMPLLTVTHVEITADSGQSTTLGVLAISVLAAKA
jgi:DNA-binding LacI/PurR family transcriptional regulator